ncbi:MAG: hypothetical protein NC937_04415 [Candidatus Omnitrophica bacterium]|nr:hypothetical protein [Candidatus Omnitrophota bacterium]MCM8825374.1 hypothetical protein [Candidatus Omnitrophota bacterium]
MKNDFFEIRLGFIYRVKEEGWEQAFSKYKKEFGISESTAKKWWKWYEKEVCVPQVCYETDSGPETIKSAKGKAKRIEQLPLVVKGPLMVEFNGAVYRIEREGLYRFTIMTKSVRNLIMVIDENSVMPILKALSLIQIHGNRDQNFSLEEKKNLVLSRYWISLTCGDIAALTQKILEDAGFKSRLVSALTTRSWNTYNNGHVLLEVFFPSLSGWVLTDIDMGYIFMQNGALVSAIEFYRCVKENRQPDFVLLSKKEIDPLWLESNGFSYSHMWRTIVTHIPSKWMWYRRIFQTFGMKENNRFIYLAEGNDAKRVFQYRGHYAKVMPEKEFQKKFYG